MTISNMLLCETFSQIIVCGNQVSFLSAQLGNCSQQREEKLESLKKMVNLPHHSSTHSFRFSFLSLGHA
jgi:hypothetical protein